VTLRDNDSHPAETRDQNKRDVPLPTFSPQKFSTRNRSLYYLLIGWIHKISSTASSKCIDCQFYVQSILSTAISFFKKTIGAFSPGWAWTPGLLQPRSPSQEESPPARIHIRLVNPLVLPAFRVEGPMLQGEQL